MKPQRKTKKCGHDMRIFIAILLEQYLEIYIDIDIDICTHKNVFK